MSLLSQYSTELEAYIAQIKQQIKNINNLSHPVNKHKIDQMLSNLKIIDSKLFQILNIKCVGHILFSRHGKCHLFFDKKLGLYPNSGLSQQAILAMQQTKTKTHQFIYFKQQITQIWVSPMIRTKQTAHLIIPDKLKNKISYDIALTENSNKPSSNYLTTIEELNNDYQKTSILQNFSKVINYKLSSILYGDQEIYKNMEKLSVQADKKLMDRSHDNKIYKDENNRISKILKKQIISEQQEEYSKQYKIHKMKQIIEQELQQKECDVWFIGHSKNLKYFFKKILQNAHNFQFGETRRVYKVKSLKNNCQSLHYFIPPYYFVIDQDDGNIKVKFNKDFLSIVKYK